MALTTLSPMIQASVPQTAPHEALLLFRMPAADPVVAPWRQRHDAACKDGIPAHITLMYPFALPDAIATKDIQTLEAVIAGVAPFTATLADTGWFGDAVLFLRPSDPAPFIGLTRDVQAAFPDWRPYGGAFERIVPHLTIGDDGQTAQLGEAEWDVTARLPIIQKIDAVEWWSGPSAASGLGGWTRARTFHLGA